MDRNTNRNVTSRKVVKNGKVIEDMREERVQESLNGATAFPGNCYAAPPSAPKRVPVALYAGRVSCVCGIAALFFACAPLICGWFVGVFWLLYLFGAVSLVTAVIAFIRRRVLAPACGVVLSVAAVVTSWMCIEAYALAAAGSVNSLTRVAKVFIDALEWPF